MEGREETLRYSVKNHCGNHDLELILELPRYTEALRSLTAGS